MSGRLSVEKHLCFNPPTLVGGSLVHRKRTSISRISQTSSYINLELVGFTTFLVRESTSYRKDEANPPRPVAGLM